MTYATLSKDDLIEELQRRDHESAMKNEAIHSLDFLEVLHHAQTDYVTLDCEHNIFNRLLEQYLKTTNSEYGFIGELFQPKGEPFYWIARSITNIAWNKRIDSWYQKILTGELKFSTEHSIYGQVIKTGKPYISNASSEDPFRGEAPTGHPALKCFLGLPLFAGNKFVGLIGIANAPGGYSESTIRGLEPLTKIASIMMMSVKVEDKRRKAYNNLKISNEKLKVKSEELEQFAYIASHDLKEPLNAIMGLSGLIQAKTQEEDHGLGRFIDRIKQVSLRMHHLIDDLLAYSRSTSGSHTFRAVDLNAIMLSVREVLRDPINNKEVNFKWDHLPSIQGIFPQIEQLFQNIVENAIKYQLPNQCPEISITSNLNMDEKLIQIYVKDNGIGIDAEYFEQIFMPFKRLHSREVYEGSGIGLSICKKIMAAHGGAISVASAVGQGSTFTLTFPVKD